MQKIKAVIFDIDGTLGNTLPLCIQAFRQTAEPLIHLPLSDEDIEATLGPNEAGTLKQLAPGSDYNRAVVSFLHHYEALHNEMCARPFDGMLDLLQALKSRSIYLAIATGKGKESCDLSLKRFGMASFFSIIKNGSLDGKQKPANIDQIIESFGAITKDETIYVGDSASDIKDSHAAGVTAIAAAWASTAKKEELEKEQPAETFEKVEDFARWLYEHL